MIQAYQTEIYQDKFLEKDLQKRLLFEWLLATIIPAMASNHSNKQEKKHNAKKIFFVYEQKKPPENRELFLQKCRMKNTFISLILLLSW